MKVNSLNPMKREFSVEISLSGFIPQGKNSLRTSLCSQENIFLILPRCPGDLVGFPPQESLFFPLFSFSFFLIFYFRRKQRKHTSADWHSESRTSLLVPQWDIYINIPPWTSFFCIFEGLLAPINTQYPKAWICSVFGEAARTSAPGTWGILPSQSGLLRAECCGTE